MNWRVQSAEAWRAIQTHASGAAALARRDWRQWLPAAGSIVAHGMALFLAVIVFSGPFRLAETPEARSLAVTLVPETLPPIPPPAAPEPVTQPPVSAAAQPADAEVLPDPERNRRRAAAVEPTTAPPSAGTPDDDVEVLPPSRSDAPLGLRSLLETDPCGQVIERLRGDCDARWAELAEQGGLDYSPRLEELAKMYPGFSPEAASSPFGIPKAPERLTRKPSLAGGRVLAPLGSVPSGIGTAGGPAAQTGRLPPASALHADPAWELPPRWLGHD